MDAESSPSHFELFGLPRKFQVDTGQLDRRYLKLQRTVHPDRFVNATDQERRFSMQQATRINEAYQTLKDPLKRGRYLLELGGYVFNDRHHTTRDPGFLTEQMELREALGGIRGSSDSLAALGGIMERITSDFDGLVTEMHACLDNRPVCDPGVAADILLKMQFFRRLQEEAQELEAILEDELA